VGRLYRMSTGSEAWCWSISTAIAPRGLSGRATTRILALQMLSDTYQAVSALNRSDGPRPSPRPPSGMSTARRPDDYTDS
jgi:hypothetical protein